ncbi:MAG: helix-turn-helix domain-containing protein, partial [Actinobacteria bacterium]|nr:helix-turn-helix domain-containing protein [Actinomycetota bacterium]
MEFRILGPLEVVDGDAAVEISGAKVRALLALLLLHPGQVVSTDRLLEGLWGDSPPATAANTLQTHVSHLRKALSRRPAGDNGQVVVTRPPGYVLAVDRAQTDAGRFEQLLEEGRRALSGGPERAAAILT